MADIGDGEARQKAFRRMNVKISSNLQEKNLDDLRYLFEAEGVALKDLEEADSGVKMFKLLEQRGLYNAHKVQVVKMALESLGREDLKKHITDFESVKIFDEDECDGSLNKPQQISSSQGETQQENLLTEKFLKELAKDIGLNWRMVARELELPEKEIEGISHDYPHQLHEQSFQALKKWKELGGEQKATALVLRRALRKQKLNAIVHKYFGSAQ